MTKPIESYPLQWPAGWPRTAAPQRSNFSTPPGKARNGMLRELELLGARNVVVTSDVPRRLDGLPRAGRASPDDQGVAVYFTLDGALRCLPCDKWHTIGDNMHAVGLSVAALRGLARWGAQHMVTAAFAGFAALPAGGTSSSPWWEVLGVGPDTSAEDIDAAYRRRARETHPDAGGDVERFHAVQEAYRAAKGRGAS